MLLKYYCFVIVLYLLIAMDSIIKSHVILYIFGLKVCLLDINIILTIFYIKCIMFFSQ